MNDPLREMMERNWPHGVRPNWMVIGYDAKITPWFRENGLSAYTSGNEMENSFVYHDGKYWFRTEQDAFSFKLRWG